MNVRKLKIGGEFKEKFCLVEIEVSLKRYANVPEEIRAESTEARFQSPKSANLISLSVNFKCKRKVPKQL